MQQPIARVRAIITDGTKLLLVKQRHDQEAKWWCLPGGGVEPGEDIVSALSRELVEELGVAPEIGQLLYVQQFWYNGAFGPPEFFFAVTNVSDYAAIDLGSTTHGLLELEDAQFVDPQAVNVRPTFLAQPGALQPEQTSLPRVIIVGKSDE